MRYTIDITSNGMTYVPSFMKTGSGIQVILKLLPRQLERLWYWLYQRQGFLKYVIDMASGCMMYIPILITIG
jgi:hypothetical protein